MEDEDPPFIDVQYIGEKTFELKHPQLGKGGQADVYAAQEIGDTRRLVAVKVVECDFEKMRKGNPSVLEKFQSEVSIWRKFAANSAYIVNLYYTFRYRVISTNKACFCFVMEYAELGDLSKNLKKRHLFASKRKDLFNFLRHIASALKEGHDQDITHGDLKPHNVLLFKRDGRVIPKLMDFGLGLSSSVDFTKFGGTPEYLAPERFGAGGVFGYYERPNDITEAKLSDIYSLGVLFFEIISGQRPYQASRDLHDNEKWLAYKTLHESGKADFESLVATGGEELKSLVERMMTVSIETMHRPMLSDVIRRLERMVEDASTLASREQECPIAIRTYRWNPKVHEILESTLYYYFIKGHSPDGDPKWFKNHLEDSKVRLFSFYNILGGYDYILRVWVKAQYADEVDKVVAMFKSHQKTDFLKFRVIKPTPFGVIANEDDELFPYQDESTLLSAIESCTNQKDREKEFNQLKSLNLISSRLIDFPTDSIRFFLTITVTGAVNEPMLSLYGQEIRKHLTKHTAAKQISVYVGGGSFQILVKFRLSRFQDFRKIFDVFKKTCDQVRIGDSAINSQTFVELDERGVFESDDGTIISELVRRADPDLID